MVLTVSGTCPVNACSATTPRDVDTCVNHLIDACYAAGADVTGSSLTFGSNLGVANFTATLTITPNGQQVACTTAAAACVVELATYTHVATWSQS